MTPNYAKYQLPKFRWRWRFFISIGIGNDIGSQLIEVVEQVGARRRDAALLANTGVRPPPGRRILLASATMRSYIKTMSSHPLLQNAPYAQQTIVHPNPPIWSFA